MKQIGIATTPVRFNDAGLPICDPFSLPYLPEIDATARARSLIEHANIDANAYSRFGGHEPFSVLEIGFGLGVNFLATVAKFQQANQSAGCRLNYVAFELYPLSQGDLARAWQACNVSRGYEGTADALLAQWPLLVHGAHRISFPGGVELTLIFGDAFKSLPETQCAANLLILDVYAPAFNPLIWSDTFVRALAAHSKPGATLVSSYHDATTREQLSRAGYQPYPAASGQSLTAEYQPKYLASRSPGIQHARRWDTNSAIVIGAGLAGMQCARELAATGWQVSIIDKQDALTGAPQQQPVVAAHPHFSTDDNPLARLTRAAYLLSRTDQQTLSPVGRLMLIDDKPLDALASLFRDCPTEFAQRVSPTQASHIAGISLSSSALWLPQMPIRVSEQQGRPQALADALGIAWLSPGELSDIRFRDGVWHCLDRFDTTIGSASVVIIATGHLPQALHKGRWPGVLSHQGQSTSIQSSGVNLQCVVGGTSYAAPLPGTNQILAGASTVNGMTEQSLSANDQRNRDRLALLLDRPAGTFTVRERHLGMRSTTRDHLPMIGPVPDLTGIAANAQALSTNDRLPLPVHPGLYLATGFGGRGLLWSYLAARCITDHVNNQSAVLPISLEQAVAPDRFIRRALRRGQYRAPLVTSSTR